MLIPSDAIIGEQVQLDWTIRASQWNPDRTLLYHDPVLIIGEAGMDRNRMLATVIGDHVNDRQGSVKVSMYRDMFHELNTSVIMESVSSDRAARFGIEDSFSYEDLLLVKGRYTTHAADVIIGIMDLGTIDDDTSIEEFLTRKHDVVACTELDSPVTMRNIIGRIMFNVSGGWYAESSGDLQRRVKHDLMGTVVIIMGASCSPEWMFRIDDTADTVYHPLVME
jgi:hypothetical protein